MEDGGKDRERDGRREGRELVQFVGRETEREWVKTRIKDGRRLIQLHGQSMVGKKRLARQVISELKEEGEEFKVVHISCSELKSWEDFLSTFDKKCRHGNSDQMNRDQIISNSPVKERLVVLVTNCERLDRPSVEKGREFEKLLLEYLAECGNVVMIVTSQKRYHFMSCSHDRLVSPLSSSDTAMLLQFLLPGVDVRPYKDVIVEHCFGLPPYILDAAACLKGNLTLGITEDDLRQYLTTENRSQRIHDNHHPMRSEELFPGLTEYLQQKVVDLSIFRGSFGVEGFSAVIGGSTVKQDLFSLYQYSVITSVGKATRSSRMKLTEYYSDLSSLLSHRVTYNDVVRLRFVSFFGEILSRANLDLYITSQQTVYGYLKDDWLNLEQVLKEAIHCTENTFEAFMKVATDADTLIVKCFPAEAMGFYETMSQVTEMYGTYEDKAVLEAKLGRVITHTKGDGLDKAMKMFEESLDVLEGTGASRELVALYQDIAFNHYKRGQYQESLRRCKDALETAKQMTLTPQLTNQIIGVRSLLAIPHIFLGHFSTAEALLEETLELARQVTPFHPSIFIMINSIGVLYERSERGDDLALQFYRASLVERKKFENMFPADLVISLNNVGMQCSKRGQHAQALKHLEEAYMIRLKINKMDFNTALTLWHMGRVNMLLCDLPKASNLLNEAVHIYNKCAKHHSVHMHVRLVQAHCHILQGQTSQAHATLLEALDYTEDFIAQTPKAAHLLLVLGHLLMLVQRDEVSLGETLAGFDTELNRFISANDGKVSQMIHNLSFGCQDCMRAVADGRTPDFDFLDDLYHPCFVCKDLEDVGYHNRRFWDQAAMAMRSEQDLKAFLVSSDILTAATSEAAIREGKQTGYRRVPPREGDCTLGGRDTADPTPSKVFQRILEISREKVPDICCNNNRGPIEASPYNNSDRGPIEASPYKNNNREPIEASPYKNNSREPIENEMPPSIVSRVKRGENGYNGKGPPTSSPPSPHKQTRDSPDSKTKSVHRLLQYNGCTQDSLSHQQSTQTNLQESPNQVKPTVQNKPEENLVLQNNLDQNLVLLKDEKTKRNPSNNCPTNIKPVPGQNRPGFPPGTEACRDKPAGLVDKVDGSVPEPHKDPDDINKGMDNDLEYGLGDQSLTSVPHGNCTLEDLMSKANMTESCRNDQSLEATQGNSGASGVGMSSSSNLQRQEQMSAKSSTNVPDKQQRSTKHLPGKERRSEKNSNNNQGKEPSNVKTFRSVRGKMEGAEKTTTGKNDVFNSCLNPHDTESSGERGSIHSTRYGCENHQELVSEVKNSKRSDSFEMLNTPQSDEIFYGDYLRQLQEQRFRALSRDVGIQRKVVEGASSASASASSSSASSGGESFPSSVLASSSSNIGRAAHFSSSSSEGRSQNSTRLSDQTGSQESTRLTLQGENRKSTRMTALSYTASPNPNNHLSENLIPLLEVGKQKSDCPPKNNTKGKNVPHCVFDTVNDFSEELQDGRTSDTHGYCHPPYLNQTLNLPTVLSSVHTSDGMSDSSEDQSLFGFGEGSGLLGGDLQTPWRRQPSENDETGE